MKITFANACYQNRFNCNKTTKTTNFRSNSPQEQKPKKAIRARREQYNAKRYLTSDFFTYSPEYVVLKPVAIKLLRGDASSLEDIAGFLVETDNEVIEEHIAAINGFFGKNERKSAQAYERIKPYVATSKQKYRDLQKQLIEAERAFNDNPNNETRAKYLRLAKEVEIMTEKANNVGTLVYDSEPVDPDENWKQELSVKIDERFMY